MVHLVVLVGIPGSGKTTFARRLLARCPHLRVVCPDDIREALYPGYATGAVDVRHINDRRVFRMAYHAVHEALEAGHSVIFDATSATRKRRDALIQIARQYGALTEAHYFPIPLEEAFRRNARRARQVPRVAIAGIRKHLVPPTRAEGFARVIVHRQR